jgi:hypothetical protein
MMRANSSSLSLEGSIESSFLLFACCLEGNNSRLGVRDIPLMQVLNMLVVLNPHIMAKELLKHFLRGHHFIHRIFTQ